MNNQLKIEMAALAENVSLARVVATAFIAPLDPSVGEISDIKTAVSEAVTNAIIHGYGGNTGTVALDLFNNGREITIVISDEGVGIEDIASAREPLFTTKPDMERSGLGFTVMESFMDSVHVISTPGGGTRVTMHKKLGEHSKNE
ncbi:MAG: anti-sigma F factor [Defluviitaleaceae bacterium]|nr:anti-sigma F factor [Defluviitaleaceae bacterium]